MYSLAWHEEAAEEVQQLYWDSDLPTRQQISDSLLEIESTLSRTPVDVGESRSGNDRIAFIGCLAIQYAVDQARQLVPIYRVYLVGTRG